MANTAKLGLPMIDDNMVADVVRDENALANAIDERAGSPNGLATLGSDGKVPPEQLNVSQPPDATTTTKGIAQLSSATNSTSETMAATPKAVKTAYDAAAAAQATANAANTTATAASNSVGPLSSLLTGAKGNTVAAINELFTSASNGKSSIAAAITGKGVLASGSDTFASLAQKISQIPTGIKVASGNFSPAITGHSGDSAAPTGTISNLPFSPKVLILYGYFQLYSVPGPIAVITLGNLYAYNINGTLAIGDSLYANMIEPNRDDSSININTVNFGVNSLSFTLKINSDSSYGASATVTKYIVLGV